MEKSHKQARALIAIGILVACCRCAFALDPALDISQYAHTAWKIRDGFTKGYADAMAQAPDGYLWLGTEFGVLRFDGVRTVPWQPPAGQHLPGTNIRSLLTARDGAIWIGTREGLARFKDGQLTQFPELAGQDVYSLLEDRDRTIWVGGQARTTGRLCAIRGARIRCEGENGSLGNGPTYIYEDSEGSLWVGAPTGVWNWKPGPPKLYAMPGQDQFVSAVIEGAPGELLIATRNGILHLVDGKIESYPLPGARKELNGRRLLRDRNGALWIGTNSGLLHIRHDGIDEFARSDGLSGDDITDIFEDREGSIWVATADGFDRFREFAVPTIAAKEGLSSDPRSVLLGADGSIWVGTREGLQAWRNGSITTYRNSSASIDSGAAERERAWTAREITDIGLPDNRIESLGQDGRGRIWVSTLRGVAYFEHDRFMPVKEVPGGYVYSIMGDDAGGLWISHLTEGLLHLREGRVVEKFPWVSILDSSRIAWSLLPDPVQGGVRLGFGRGGVAYFKDGRVRSSYGVINGLGEGPVFNLQRDGGGTLWAATEGGLSRFKDGHFSTLSSHNGLPCDAVHWMMEDDFHSVWLGTACGLVRVDRAELDEWVADPNRRIQSTVFDSTDGVRSNAHSAGYSPTVTKSWDGKIWFLTRRASVRGFEGAGRLPSSRFDGVNVIDPRHLPRNELPPPVRVEQITADRKTYDASSDVNGHLRLPPLIRSLVIDYTALSLVVPEKNLFRYKLEGLDRDWQNVGSRRQAFYNDLPPGNYRFRVVASNNSGVWNEQGAALDFSIAPAYYQTTWFRGLCAATFLALLWALYQFRIQQLRRQERKLRDVIETMPTFAWTALPDGSVDFVNRHWEEYTGLAAERIVGSGWQEATHPEDLKRNVEKWGASLATGEPFEDEVRYRRAADGQYRRFLSRAVPYRDGRGKILKWYGTSADIEDRKRAEEEREKLRSDLAHMNRLSILGELAASLSHELKQPIAAAMTNARTCMRWLKRDQPDVNEALEATSRIVKDGTRATEIIDRLRSLYRKSPPRRELVDVDEIVCEMRLLLQDEANRIRS
jgi:PAS domain S-box-containing protein